uniref:P-type phospholipid transporter n=1 Tax=Panagrolaimus sp. ES5 TaxID=591445 RepID=A0AC34GGA1_9BILA
MNTTLPESKVGLLDLEVNNLTKILFLFVVLLSSAMIIMKGLDTNWYRYLMRFVLLFSYIIPISIRVNLDLAKLFFSWQIGRDKTIPDTVVRSSTIPEELGRISYLLSDKTGTLTKNEMIFKKIHLGSVSFSGEFKDVAVHIQTAYSGKPVEAIALCHNVTPIEENGKVDYQASSPDEVALVEWTEKIGLRLAFRDLAAIELELKNGNRKKFQILHMFPFTSESKRMGIILK